MPAGWTSLTCESCGGKLMVAGAPFGYILASENPLSGEAIARIREMFDAMAEDPKPHQPIILSGSMKMRELKHPVGGILRCESCGMLYERQAEDG